MQSGLVSNGKKVTFEKIESECDVISSLSGTLITFVDVLE